MFTCITLIFFYKKPNNPLSPQSFLKKWLLEPSKFLISFLISRMKVPCELTFYGHRRYLDILKRELL